MIFVIIIIIIITEEETSTISQTSQTIASEPVASSQTVTTEPSQAAESESAAKPVTEPVIVVVEIVVIILVKIIVKPVNTAADSRSRHIRYIYNYKQQQQLFLLEDVIKKRILYETLLIPITNSSYTSMISHTFYLLGPHVLPWHGTAAVELKNGSKSTVETSVFFFPCFLSFSL